MFGQTGDCYVYELAYPESMGGAVFYVGQGRGNRINQHEYFPVLHTQTPKCEAIRQIWRAGEQVVKRKVGEGLSERAARHLEWQLIRNREESLTNRKIGGPSGQRKIPLVQVGISISGTLRDEIEQCMLLDGIEYSRETCYEYIKSICYPALHEHVQKKLRTSQEQIRQHIELEGAIIL